VPDFVLQDDQTNPVAIVALDDAGNAVPGVLLDAGSAAAVVSDPTVLTAVVSPDQSTVQVTAEGPEATGTTVTVNGTLNGAPVTAVLAIDVTTSPAVGIGLVPGTSVHK
jgi:hypothetical protein